MFPSPKIDLSVEVQTASRAPFVFVISVVERGTNEGTENRVREYRETYKGDRVNRHEHLAPTVGHDLKHCPTSKNKKDQEDEKYEARICCTKRGRKPHPATYYGNDAGPPRRSGCVKSGSRTHPC